MKECYKLARKLFSTESESWSPKSHVSRYLNELELWLNIQEEPFKRKKKKKKEIWAESGEESAWLKFSKFCLFDANSINFISQVHGHTMGLCFLFSKVLRPSPRETSEVCIKFKVTRKMTWSQKSTKVHQIKRRRSKDTRLEEREDPARNVVHLHQLMHITWPFWDTFNSPPSLTSCPGHLTGMMSWKSHKLWKGYEKYARTITYLKPGHRNSQ